MTAKSLAPKSSATNSPAESAAAASPESTKPALVHADELLYYSFGPEHPMGPDRVRLAMYWRTTWASWISSM